MCGEYDKPVIWWWVKKADYIKNHDYNTGNVVDKMYYKKIKFPTVRICFDWENVVCDTVNI